MMLNNFNLKTVPFLSHTVKDIAIAPAVKSNLTTNYTLEVDT